MNYLKQLNEFADKRLEEPLNPNAVLLYFILLEYANKVRWKKWFSAPNLSLQVRTGGLSRQQIDRARSELVQKGYIEYKKSSGNQAGRYLMVEFDTHSDTPDDTHDNIQCDIQNDTQRDIQPEHEVTTLNKLNINKTKQKSSTNVLPKESRPRFTKPTIEEIQSYCLERKNEIDPNRFFDYYESNGWKVGKNSMKDWKATVRNWETRQEKSLKPESERKYPDTSYNLAELEERLLSGSIEYD